jgi:hypothetical protein
MQNFLKINRYYLSVTVTLFLIELFIALFVHDRFVRPFFGDFLVVILLFYFFKTITTWSNWNIAWLSLGISYVVELLQYFKALHYLGLQQNQWVTILAGNSFAWEDMLAYTLGVLVVLSFETNVIKYYFPNSDPE